jgi:N-acyl-D-aspartate/D-glutamate deacylase
MRCDLVLRNGLVFDGFNEGRFSDVAVHEGRIVALGENLQVEASREFDASKLWITPGFVDIHTHYDLEVELAPSLSESVRHGVTSVVMGGCSLSTVFGEPVDLAYIFSRVETLPSSLIASWLKTAQCWTSPFEYFEHLRTLQLGPNVACMLGHSALRVQVMGLKRSISEHATAAEIEQMRLLATAALDAGCIGISIDMVHWHKISGPFAGQALPSHHAAFAEYKMLADLCRSYDAVFQVTPNPQNPWSLFDILRLSPGVWRAPLRCTILAALDMSTAPHLWRVYSLLLFVCNSLLGCNIRFQTLAEPFVIYADGWLTPFFEEFSAGVKLNNCETRAERMALWSQSGFKQEFKKSWLGGFPRTFHRNFDLMTIAGAPDQSLVGKTIGGAAVDASCDPLDYFIELLEKYDDALRWFACNANQRPHIRHKLMSHPHILPGFSDAGAHSRNLAFFDNSLSVLRQAVSSEFMPFHRAVARVTSEPARWFNLDGGCIKVGVKADLVVLNPEKLRTSIPSPSLHVDSVLRGASRMVKRDDEAAVSAVFIKGNEVVRAGAPLPNLSEQQHGDVLLQVNRTGSQQEALERYRNRISFDSSYGDDDMYVDFNPGRPVTRSRQSISLYDSVKSYWPIFLLKHQHPANVAMHCFAFVLMYAIAGVALIQHKYWMLLLMPLSQGTGLLGHWLFEPTPIDQRDTIFSWRAFASLHLMFFSVLTGRYSSQLTQAQILVLRNSLNRSSSIQPARTTTCSKPQ